MSLQNLNLCVHSLFFWWIYYWLKWIDDEGWRTRVILEKRTEPIIPTRGQLDPPTIQNMVDRAHTSLIIGNLPPSWGKHEVMSTDIQKWHSAAKITQLRCYPFLFLIIWAPLPPDCIMLIWQFAVFKRQDARTAAAAVIQLTAERNEEASLQTAADCEQCGAWLVCNVTTATSLSFSGTVIKTYTDNPWRCYLASTCFNRTRPWCP